MAYAFKPKNCKSYRIYWRDPETEKLLSISANTANKRTAEQIAKEKTDLLKSQASTILQPLVNNTRLTLAELLELFLKLKSNPKTARAYRTAVTDWINTIGNKLPDEYTPADYFHYRSHLNQERSITYKKQDGTSKRRIFTLSESTKFNYISHIRIFFKYLVESDIIPKNIIKRIPEPDNEIEYIPKKELDEILVYNSVLSKYTIDLLKLKYLAALRANELLALTVEDIMLDSGKIRIRNSKGKRIDYIPIVADLKAHLLQMRLPQTGKITWYTYSGIRSAFRRLTKNKYHVHQLRISRGTHLANLGVAPLFLKEYMRHKSIRTTEKYYAKILRENLLTDINNKLQG